MDVSIPKRFGEVTTWKGGIDQVFMDAVAAKYQISVRQLADQVQKVQGL